MGRWCLKGRVVVGGGDLEGKREVGGRGQGHHLRQIFNRRRRQEVGVLGGG